MIEVTDSPGRDTEAKVSRYGQAGIPEAWQVDLTVDRIRVWREPGPDGFLVAAEYRGGDLLAPQGFPDVTLTVAEIVGPAAPPTG